jgi:hypothetical protein
VIVQSTTEPRRVGSAVSPVLGHYGKVWFFSHPNPWLFRRIGV